MVKISYKKGGRRNKKKKKDNNYINSTSWNVDFRDV